MIYMPIHYTEGALIAVQSKQLGLNKPVVGGDGLAADQVSSMSVKTRSTAI